MSPPLLGMCTLPSAEFPVCSHAPFCKNFSVHWAWQLSRPLALVEQVVGTPSLAVSWRQEHLKMRNSWSLLDAKVCLAILTQLQQLGHPTLTQRVPRSLQRAHKTGRILKQSPETAVQILATVGCSCLLCSGECRDHAVSCFVHLISMFMHIAVINSSSLPYFMECLVAAKWQPLL